MTLVTNPYQLLYGWARFFVFLTCLGWSLIAQVQAETLAVVVRSQNMPEYPQGMEISEDTEIRTDANQQIALKTRQGDILVANKNSTIKLVKPGFFQHLFGKIYYFIAPRKQNNVQVETTTATIGVRGTKFLIDSAGSAQKQDSVALSEGMLNFESRDDVLFELYNQRELTEFELFRRQMQSEFDAFKQQLEEEFVAYQNSIDLESGFSLAFDGKRVVRMPNDAGIEMQFREFEAFISENSAE